MKATVIATLLLVGTAAFAAPKTVLLKSSMHPGFFGGPNAQSVDVTVSSDGKVLRTVWTKDAKVSEKIAVLSAASVKRISAKIDAIDKDTKLVDPNEGGPECMDAGFKNITMTKDGEEKQIQTNSGCHISSLEYGAGYELIKIVEGFESLGR